MRKFRKKTQIIHALDLDNIKNAFRIAENIKECVDVIKISHPLLIQEGYQSIQRLKNIGLPILLDFKVGDIPEMSRRIIMNCIDYGADGFTVQGFLGRDVIRECVETAKKADTAIYVVAEMSHPGASEFLQPVSNKIAEISRDLGASGIVAPGNRPSRITELRKIVGDELQIISPGIGPQGGDVGDAILAGADFEIVGRMIYTAKNPAEKAREILDTLNKRLKNVNR